MNGGLCGSYVNESVCLIAQFTSFQENDRRLFKIKTTDDIIMWAENPRHAIPNDIQEGCNLMIEGKLTSKTKIVIDSLSVFPSGVEGQVDFDGRIYNEMISLIVEHGPQFLNSDTKDLMDHWGTTDPGIDGSDVQIMNPTSLGERDPPTTDKPEEKENSFTVSKPSMSADDNYTSMDFEVDLGNF